ncbi:hypothetical protein LNTAR_24908 [Lentisphaera araneosa HTCC2155]|uniref:Uncharacterized protein n=1 Tax=Lentisphaera araneosa HTCC2155 TaxID=313628 RepID=A6DSY9_9BACT|nr:hypothetical protein LNTAR_24908 [Lentisphaera araneosa HTCC2155]
MKFTADKTLFLKANIKSALFGSFSYIFYFYFITVNNPSIDNIDIAFMCFILSGPIFLILDLNRKHKSVILPTVLINDDFISKGKFHTININDINIFDSTINDRVPLFL